MSKRELSVPEIVTRIVFIRGKKVMLDSDLASMYGVETKVLNQAVKRNLKRFPEDFFFQLTQDEWYSLRSQIVTLEVATIRPIGTGGRGKFRKFLPYAFTEHGALMLASILQSETAINTSIFIVRAFIKLRELVESNKELSKKIEELEARYDKNFSTIFEAIKQLIHQKNEPVRKIGYRLPKKKD